MFVKSVIDNMLEMDLPLTFMYSFGVVNMLHLHKEVGAILAIREGEALGLLQALRWIEEPSFNNIIVYLHSNLVLNVIYHSLTNFSKFDSQTNYAFSSKLCA